MPQGISSGVMLLGILWALGVCVSQALAQAPPLTIQPATGHVGVGTASPAYPLQVEGAVGATHLYSTGAVGIGTGAPATGLHVVSTPPGGTPWIGSLLLEPATHPQTGALSIKSTLSSGDTNRMWTLLSGMATDGPGSFRIFDSTAMAERLAIDPLGHVGLGRSPSTGGQWLEVEGSVGVYGSDSSGVLVESAGAIEVKPQAAVSPASRIGLYASLGSLPGYPTANYPTLKVPDFPYLYFSIGGNYSAYMTTGGVLYSISTRDRKENFVSLNPDEIVRKIETLPLSRWNYTGDDPRVTHIGPMAEEFNPLFGFHQQNPVGVPSMAASDVASVALAGVQGLAQRLQARDAEIADLKARLLLLERAVQLQP